MEQVLSEAENNEVELGPAVTVYGSPWPTQCVTHLDLSDLQEDWHPAISRPSQNMLVLNHIYESLRKKNYWRSPTQLTLSVAVYSPHGILWPVSYRCGHIRAPEHS